MPQYDYKVINLGGKEVTLTLTEYGLQDLLSKGALAYNHEGALCVTNKMVDLFRATELELKWEKK